MAYNEKLAERIRRRLSDRTDVVERKMFGGLAFMVKGHMCCGVVGDELMVRVGPETYEAALKEEHVREMDFTGKPLRSMVYVAAPGLASAKQLGKWIERGLRFALTLPEKR
jgi:TfoX/Sxy family transcriptional regulator of competence genes